MKCKILEAASITVGACESCPAVHVNLIDIDGNVFATANVPAETCAEFIVRFRACATEIAQRHSAPSRQQ